MKTATLEGGITAQWPETGFCFNPISLSLSGATTETRLRLRATVAAVAWSLTQTTYDGGTVFDLSGLARAMFSPDTDTATAAPGLDTRLCRNLTFTLYRLDGQTETQLLTDTLPCIWGARQLGDPELLPEPRRLVAWSRFPFTVPLYLYEPTRVRERRDAGGYLNPGTTYPAGKLNLPLATLAAAEERIVLRLGDEALPPGYGLQADIRGQYIIRTDGTFRSDDERFSRTDYMAVVPGDVVVYTGVTKSGSLAVAGYDQDKRLAQVLLGVNASAKNLRVTAPEGISFIACCGCNELFLGVPADRLFAVTLEPANDLIPGIFTREFDHTFRGQGPDVRYIRIAVGCEYSDPERQVYLRWLDPTGGWRYFLFRLLQTVRTAADSERNRESNYRYTFPTTPGQTLTGRGGPVGRAGSLRYQIGAAWQEPEVMEYLLTVLTAPFVDRYQPRDGSWVRSRVVTGQGVDNGQPLQELVIEIEEPQQTQAL